MTYFVQEHDSRFMVMGARGAMLRDGGFGQFGEPVLFSDRARAEAKAAWLNLPTSVALMTASEKRAARAEIAGRFGIAADVARGLLN